MTMWLNECIPAGIWTDDPNDPEIYGPKPYGSKTNVWGGITSRGALSLEVFRNYLNSIDYVKIIRRRKNYLDDLFPDGYYWMQDRDSKHKADIGQDFINEELDKIMQWPKASIDLNPIENVWAWLKRSVTSDQPKSLDEMEDSIIANWRFVTAEFLRPFYESMPQRMKEVIARKGGKIDY